jgi:OOP family OmpA-OmpF porin
MKTAALCASLLLIAIPAFADLPHSLNQVDPQAPCFRWPAADVDGDGVYDRVDHCPGTPKGCTVDQWGCSTDADGDGVCDGLDRCPNTPAGAKVDAGGCSEAQAMAMSQPPSEAPKHQPAVEKAAPPPAPLAPAAEQPAVSLGADNTVRLDNLHFEKGSANITEDSHEQLNEVVRAMERYPDARVEIQGHTDTQGAAAYNLKLSQSRAEAVRTWLIDNGHVDASRMVAKGYGETRPEVQPERTAADRTRNRRVVLKVLNPEVLPKGTKVEH